MPLTVKVSTAYAVCSILQKCLSIITMPLFTRLLTTEQYGQFTIYHSWRGILAIAITLNLAYGSFSTAMVKYEDDRDGYISSVEGICLTLACLFTIVYLPFRDTWNRLFELPTPIMCVMIGEILCMTGISLWSGKMRFEFRYKEVVGVTLLISVLSPLLALLLVVNNDEKGYARIIGYAAVNIVIGALFYIRSAVKGKKFFNKDYWKYALGFNIPLLAYYFSQIIFNQSDRIMISHMVGTDKAAIYGVAYSLAMVLTFVLNAINNSYVPWYYEKLKTGKGAENRPVSAAIAFLMAILLSGIIWFAPEIVLLMAGEKYMEAIYVVPPIAVCILLLFYSQLFINVEFYYEDKKSLVAASIWAAVINLALNWVCIRRFGYYAAAYTTLASYLVFAGMNCMVMKRVLREKGVPDDAFDYKALVTLFLIFGVVTAAAALLYDLILVRIAVSAAVLIGLAVKREYFISMYRSLKGKDLPKNE